MAKVAMMSSGLRRKPTYEEVIDYIENDPDKIKYPNRAAKFLRSTFQLSQLDGAGQALLEQQQVEEMKERLKNHQLQQLATQNNTDARVEKAIQQGGEQPKLQQPHIQQSASSSGYAEGGSSSSGLVRNIVGGVITGAGTVARGIGSMFGGSAIEEQYHTPSGTPPHTPLPKKHDETVIDYENDQLNELWDQRSRRSQTQTQHEVLCTAI